MKNEYIWNIKIVIWGRWKSGKFSEFHLNICSSTSNKKYGQATSWVQLLAAAGWAQPRAVGDVQGRAAAFSSSLGAANRQFSSWHSRTKQDFQMENPSALFAQQEHVYLQAWWQAPVLHMGSWGANATPKPLGGCMPGSAQCYLVYSKCCLALRRISEGEGSTRLSCSLWKCICVEKSKGSSRREAKELRQRPRNTKICLHLCSQIHMRVFSAQD